MTILLRVALQLAVTAAVLLEPLGDGAPAHRLLATSREIRLRLGNAGLVAVQPAAGLDPRLKAVLRVDAWNCVGGKARRGSGFVWRSASTVVTALHVIAGCATIQVWYPTQGGLQRKASWTHVRRETDLALLLVEDPVNVAPLSESKSLPEAGAQLTAWGYPIVMQGLIDARFIRRTSGGTLDAVLDNDLTRQHLVEAGMPSLSTEVLWLDANTNLFPGVSGGPFLDDEGQVAGIADGGLEQGATGVNWAIPATALRDLVSSPESFPGTAVIEGAAHRYALETVGENKLAPLTLDIETAASARPLRIAASGETDVSCGGTTFVKTRTRSLEEIAPSADDQTGLHQLLSLYGRFLSQTDAFDIYQDLQTGASIVVPGGATVRSSDDGLFCVADVLDRTLQEVFQVASDPSAASVAGIQAYQTRLSNVLGLGWQTNPALTYVQPFFRTYDRLTVQRQSQIQYVQLMPVRFLFQTLALRPGRFLGVTALRNDYTVQRYQFESYCADGGQNAMCAEALTEVKRAAQMYVATHLSTFPIN